MKRMMASLVGALLLFAPPVAGHAQEDAPARSYAGGEPNRLTDDVQRELVADALRRIEAGDIPGAVRKFDEQLSGIVRGRGPHSLQAADAITAFAAQLYNAGRLSESLPYFRATVDAYRQARGGDHPDVAVAQQDYSRMLVEQAPDAPPAEAVTLLEDAYRIRAKTLGQEDAETAVNLSLLGQLKGLPAITNGDPRKIEDAADLLRRAIALLPKCANKLPRDLPDARFRLVVLYASNDRVSDSLKAFDAFLKADRADAESVAEEIAGILQDHGHADAAKSVLALRPLQSA